MLRSRSWFFVVFTLILGSADVSWATTHEERAFATAASAFQDGMWSRAEVEFAQFAEEYPKSDKVAQAILLEGESDFKQQKFLPAISLLTSHESQSGNLADQYLYWLGEAQFGNREYTAAAVTFGKLVQAFPDSKWCLDAVVNEAAAYTKLGQWNQAGALLLKSGGTFQTAADKHPTDERVVRGQLLIAEALLRQNKVSEASTLLHSLAIQKLSPALNWQATRLLCQAQLASGDTDAALISTSNMIEFASLSGDAEMRAASVVEQGKVLQKMGRTEDALQVYEENLTNAPAAWQREAILKMAELAAAQGRFSAAEDSLQKFIAQYPNSPAMDIALLSLGELQLTNYVASGAIASATNQLQSATTVFNQFLETCTNSPLLGKAYLDRGWCLWLSGQTNASLADFSEAARRLPPSEDLAVARFKMADAQFAERDFSGARENYESVWQDFTNFPAVDKVIAPQALYQTVRACMELRDMEGTTNALARILTLYPMSNLADNSVLLAGEELSDLQHPAEARALFEKFAELYPDSSLRPQAELALARTYEQEEDWAAAIAVYDGWMKRYGDDQPLLPQVEYARAMANYQAGDETNAFMLLTNFVAQFPTNGLAPVAQWWIGDYYYNTGTNYADAEKNYKLLFQNWPNSPLAYQATLMAGRAAMGRQGYSDAIGYFTMLTSDSNCPPNVAVQALFGYGGALMQEQSSDTNNPLANFDQARQVFEAICETYPQSEQAALAWGEIGNCYLQLAGQPQGAHFYTDATNAYFQVISSPKAGVAARSQAQVGIGLVFEKQAALTTGQAQTMWLQKALENDLDVLYGKNLRDGESADPFWVKEAGLQAAGAAETLGEWPQAMNIYRRLEELFPPLRDLLEKKIANAQANVSAKQN